MEEQIPTNRAARMSARKAFSLNRATRIISPTIARTVAVSKVASRPIPRRANMASVRFQRANPLLKHPHGAIVDRGDRKRRHLAKAALGQSTQHRRAFWVSRSNDARVG